MSILFKGDNKGLINSINALLALDAKGSLVPHGIGEMARDLLKTCAARLPAEQHQGDPGEVERLRAERDAIRAEFDSYYQPQFSITQGSGPHLWSVHNRIGGGFEFKNVYMDCRGVAGLDQQEAMLMALISETINRLKKLRAGKEPSAPKCKLCDHLQADLTARDQQIDALRQGMKGDYDLDAWLAFVEEAPQLRVDAARYRWLRDFAGASYGTMVGDQRESSAEKDASIDEGMARETSEKRS